MSSESFAVLPFDTAGDGGDVAVSAAAAMRSALRHAKLEVLSVEATRALFAQRLNRGGTPLTSYQDRLGASDQAVNEADSLAILDTLIADLAADPEFSRDKHALLELARLKLAARYVSLAGPKETGNAETNYGKLAKRLLVDARRANPKLEPSKLDFPPRFHLLFHNAGAAIRALGFGGLHIDSRPRGATVLVEAFDVGKTPLVLNDMVAKGSYRVWVEVEGARSVPQLLDVGERVTPVFVDLAFEGVLWAEGPGLRPLKSHGIDEEAARKIADFLDVDHLLLVGNYPDDAESLWGAAFSVAAGTAARRGTVRMSDDVPLEAAAATLASFLGSGSYPPGARGIEERPLPASVLLPKGDNVAGHMGHAIAHEGVPWLVVGVIGGSVVVAGLLTIGIVALVASQPRDGALMITATRLE